MTYQLTAVTSILRLADNAFIPPDPANTWGIKVKSIHHLKQYYKFIENLKNQIVEGYVEVHHIIPVSLGGTNNPTNLIKLTSRQHFIAHWILAKALGGLAARAFFMMSNLGKYGKVNSVVYENARCEYSKLVSEQMRIKPIVRVFTEEYRAKLSKAKKGRKLSLETRKKISDCQRGAKSSEETRKKISESKKGKIGNDPRHIKITWDNKTQTRAEWEREFGLRRSQLRDWTRYGKMTIKEAMKKGEKLCIN